MSASIPYRKHARLQTFDYSQAGAYFVTVVTQGRKSYFGEIQNATMISNSAGQAIEYWWLKLPEKFPRVTLDEYCLMPNHFHGIVMVHEDSPTTDVEMGALTGALLREDPVMAEPCFNSSLSTIMQWFKTMTTNAYIAGVKGKGWLTFQGKLWQRSYYEHIIRDENDMLRVQQYILDNPLLWALDAENPAVSS